MSKLGARADRPLGRAYHRIAAALATGVLFATCAQHPVLINRKGPPRTLFGQEPDGAYLFPGELVLRYPAEGTHAYVSAHWEDCAPDCTRHTYRVAELEVPGESTAELDRMLGGAAPVRLISADKWNEILARILYELAPEAAGEAVLITVQGQDFAVFRDEGRLRTTRLVDIPPGLHVKRAFSEDEFADRANRFLARELPGRDAVLAATGARGAPAWLLFDPARRISVYVIRPQEPPFFGPKTIGFALRSAEALLLQSHLLTPLKSPVTSSRRLLWSALQTSRALVPAMPELERGVPPLAGAEPMDPGAWEGRLDHLVSSRRQRGGIRFLIDGKRFFPRLIEALRDARESIWMRVYLFDRDDVAVEIADLLKRRSREVDVRVLLDSLGTLAAGQAAPAGPMPAGFEPPASIFEYLGHGSDVHVLASPNPWLTSDHTKTVFVDRRIVFLGGMNIGREYRYEWHDLMAEIDGPIVRTLAEDFVEQWDHAAKGDIRLLLESLGTRPQDTPDEAPAAYAAELRPLYTRTAKPEILNAQLAAMRSARRLIYIEQPYLSDDEILSELIDARRRGVDVRVILPGRDDSGFMTNANLVATNLLLKHGIRVFAYPGVTHLKAALYDGWACFGSANMDQLSLRVNQEIDLGTSSPDVVARLRHDLFEIDFARSREITQVRSLGWSVYLSDFLAKQF